MFCSNCGMLKSNCVCGNNNKSTKSNNKPKEDNVSPQQDDFISIIPKKDNVSPQYYDSINIMSKDEILDEITNSIEDGYEFIVLESNYENSDIAVKLANNFKSSIISTANEKSFRKYNKKYNLTKNSKINLINQKDLFNRFDSIEKSDLLIIDDAHRLDENIVSLFSYSINLSKYEDLVNKFKLDVKDLPKKYYTYWIDFINYLKLSDDEKIRKIVECFKKNPENWICSYEFFKNPKLSFMPLNIGNLAKKYWFSKGEITILISSSILDFDLFIHELGLESSKVKLIRFNLPINFVKNKIFARKTVNMRDNNLKLLIPFIKEILEKHKNEKGLILTNRYSYSRDIISKLKDQRLLTYRNFDYTKKIEKFKKNSNSVMVTDLLEDGIEFPYDECKFQIIVKQHNYSNNSRSKRKEKESNWYSYKQVINIFEQLQKPITSESDYCITYILDESIIKSIVNDIYHNKFIPRYIVDLIVDLDMKNQGLVCDNVKKQFGVYYLFEYYKDKKTENKKIWAYKDYDKENPDMYVEEFNEFTNKFMKAISELANQIINVNINKLALVSIPSSTVERNKCATVKESINLIEKWFLEGKTKSEFNCKKEIINCGDLLKRVSDVPTSHLHKKRASYFQHMNSIECEKNSVLEMDDVAFIILDDISTRGTIMNACEDILINNGVKKRNIYKFALFKTQRR